jgi:hypothetical protein
MRFKRDPDGTDRMIIQITTLGREPKLVQRTVDTIRGYGLGFPYEIWVVIEPGYPTDYRNVDQVLVVPAEFKSRAIDKARALHYALTRRIERGLDNRYVKVLLLDDDTLPSKRYVVNSFQGDYDYCQGVTVVNREYGRGPWQHWLASLFDGIRARNCLIYCSCTQGITNKPLFVHGEGLCIRGHAERDVGWNWPIVASDDFVHGTNAAYQGYSWGYHLAYIQLVSPWTIKASILQKHRWTWGNFMAIWRRDITPLSVGLPKGIKYAVGFVSVTCSAYGGVALATGLLKVPQAIDDVYVVSIGAWIFSYALSAFVNSGGEDTRLHFRERVRASGRPPVTHWRVRYAAWRVYQTIVGVVMVPVTALAPAFIIGLAVWMGKNRTRPPFRRKDGKGFTFEVIDKTRENAARDVAALDTTVRA